MPDMYAPNEYDLAGFIVGVVEHDRLLDGSRIEPGDRLLGLPSVGLHTNGFSLARKLFFDRLGLMPDSRVAELDATVAEVLLSPHRSYYGGIEPLLDRSLIKAMAHITGGGITDNLPRILPAGTAARVEKGTWPVLPVFRFIKEKGSIEESEMYRTFNMGIGMILVAGNADCATLKEYFVRVNEPCYEIGEIISGDGSVVYAG
jgi:phosphoribosylformylglycinamidine cyclo-ligase